MKPETYMDSLKILVPYPSSFNDVSNTSILFEKLLPIFKQKTNLTILWLNYQPEKLKLLPKYDSVETLDIHNYKNAVDVIQKEKPDVIYTSPYESFIDMAFSYAGKSLKVPVVNLLYYELSSGVEDKTSRSNLLRSYMKRLSSDTVPSEVHQNKKTPFRRGKFILFKFSFFLKSLFACKINMIKRLKILIMVFGFYFSPLTHVDPRLALTMHFVQNESIKNDLIDSGIDSSSIEVTGHPMFDDIFKKTLNKKTQNFQGRKIRVILAPISFYEYADWTKEQSDYILKEIITKIQKHKNNFSLTVKIHPSAALLSDYKKIIQSIDPKIPVIQKGSIEEYLDDCDVMISYYSWSTAVMYALFGKTPIVICNFFGFKDDEMINRGLVIECKDSSTLIDSIYESVKNNPATDEKRNEYIERFFYKMDGFAAERICDAMLKITNKNFIQS